MPVGVGDLPDWLDGDGGLADAGGYPPAAGDDGNCWRHSVRRFQVTGRPDVQHAGQDRPAGQVGRHGEDSGGDVRGGQGLGHRADGLATGGREPHPGGSCRRLRRAAGSGGELGGCAGLDGVAVDADQLRGKSHLAATLGYQACRRGHDAFFTTCSRLLADRSFETRVRKFAKITC